MTTNPYTMSEFLVLLEQTDTNRLVIPNFQRRFEWDRQKQRRLAASVFCQLPVGAMVVYSGAADDFAHSRLCIASPMESQRTDVNYLLDGQQRLATLRSILADPFDEDTDWTEAWRVLYSPLQTRWYLDLGGTHGSPPPLGARDHEGFPALNLAHARGLPVEPSEIEARIIPQRITKSKGSQSNPPWWHPAFEAAMLARGVGVAEVRTKIASAAAANDAIPLWELARTKTLDDQNIEPLHALAARHLSRKLEGELREVLDSDSQDPRVQAVLAPERAGVSVQYSFPDDLTDLLTRRSSDWASAVGRTLEKLVELQIPMITVRGGDLGRAVTIFENINEGGTPLTAFDLVNAKAVRDRRHQRPLRERVADQLGMKMLDVSLAKDQLTPGEYQAEVWAQELSGVSKADFPAKPANIRNQFLNLLSVFGHGQDPRRTQSEEARKPLTIEYLKRDQQLKLTAERINGATDVACTGLLRACLFLQSRVGKVAPERINYALMLIPLAVVLAEDRFFGSAAAWAKLEYWYWVSLFGGRYREAQNETCVRDVARLYRWCAEEDDNNPYGNDRSRVFSEPRYSDQQAFLPDGDAAATAARGVGEGIMEFTLSKRPRDLLPRGWSKVMLSAAEGRRKVDVQTEDGDTNVVHEYKMELEAHHIVPLGCVTRVGETTGQLRARTESLYNSPLNMTMVSGFANDLIGKRSPILYFRDMEREVLAGHCVLASGAEICAQIKADAPLAETPRESGIREVLKNRFATVTTEVGLRLDALEKWAGG